MLGLESIKDYLQGRNQKELMRLLFGYLVASALLVTFLLYSHSNALAGMRQKTKLLNKARRDIQVVFTEHEAIKNKKNEVDALLAQDKNFYLVKFCQDTLAPLSMVPQAPLSLTSQVWPNGYTEESVQINVTLVTMKQVCQLLQALQANPRIFIKSLDLLKGTVDKKITMNMSVATLKPVVEKTNSTK